MSSVFVTFTPYHVLLACGIALSQQKPAKNYLFVISDFGSSKALMKAFRSWRQSPFLEVRCLPGIYKEGGTFRRRIIVRRNAVTIARLVRTIRPDRVYVFNDSRAESQAALYYSKLIKGGVRGVYVEDGANAYRSYERMAKERTWFEALLGRVFYGSWWEDVSVSGTSHWVEEVKAAFPHLIRSELRSKRKSEISRKALLGLAKQSLLYEYLKELNVDLSLFNELDAILVIAHSGFASTVPKYERLVKKILRLFLERGLRVAVKYHPRDSLADYLSVRRLGGVAILPQQMPLEFMFILIPDRIKLVVGDLSTSLLTAKWLLDDVEVISVAPILGCSDPQLLETFRKLGVRLVDSAADLNAILKVSGSCGFLE